MGALLAGKLEWQYAPLIAINEAEATDLAKALDEIARLHEITINPKIAAYGNLIAVCGIVYGGRVMMVRAMLADQQRRAPPRADNVAPVASVVVMMDEAGALQ
jgi:hypothetical protein